MRTQINVQTRRATEQSNLLIAFLSFTSFFPNFGVFEEIDWGREKAPATTKNLVDLCLGLLFDWENQKHVNFWRPIISVFYEHRIKLKTSSDAMRIFISF